MRLLIHKYARIVQAEKKQYDKIQKEKEKYKL